MRSLEAGKVALNGINHRQETIAGLPLQGGVRAPCLNALFNGLFMHHIGIQMHHRAEQAAGIDDGRLVFTAGAVAVA